MLNKTVFTLFLLTASLFNLNIQSTQAATIKFTTWNTLGDVLSLDEEKINISNSSFGNQNDYDFNPSNPDAYSYTQNKESAYVNELESFFSLNSGALDSNDNFAYEGSGISTNITVANGDKISFIWNFFTNEAAINIGLFTALNDFAFFIVDDNVIKLTDVNNALNPSKYFRLETGENLFSYTFTKTGSYKIGIGIVDINDFSGTSALEIKAGTIERQTERIPEPSLILGSLITFGLNAIFKKVKAAVKD